MQIRSRRQLRRLAAACVFALCGPAVGAEPELRLTGSFQWSHPADWFGGWSAIEVGDAGTGMVIVSDRGRVLHASLLRPDGPLAGITINDTVTLQSPDGRPLVKQELDSEGLAVATDGTAYISFEHRNRIMRTDLDSGEISGRISVPFTDGVGRNAGLEALAIDGDGTLFAVAEEAPQRGAPFLLYSFRSGRWEIAAEIPKRGPFLPVGADFDPAGRLWLLERAATLLGFRSRIRLFDLSLGTVQERTLLMTPPGQFDNLEGLSVWQDAAGALHVTMISDDNFLRIQRTQIVEYAFEE